MTIIVLGRFPPPIDGQTLATERLATLLERDLRVCRIDTETAQSDGTASASRFLYRAAHFVRLRSFLRARLREVPSGDVLWPAISPDIPGHFRDLFVTLRAVDRSRRIYAVVHRGNFHQLFESRATRATAQRFVRRIHRFVFLTDHLSERCADWIPHHKRIVIPNTLDDELIFSDSEVLEKQAMRRRRERLSLLFVGHMLASKGYLDVLEAVEEIHRSGASVEMHFVGRWSNAADREQFEGSVHARGLENVIVHHGSLAERAAIKSLYRSADAVLLPTYYRNEAQPLVLLEALGSGTPVVTTRHAGIPEMIRDRKEGLLVPARDPKGIVRAVNELVDLDFWQQLSTAARQRFLNQYAPDEVRRKWRALVEAGHSREWS